jgi:hypothetical protein
MQAWRIEAVYVQPQPDCCQCLTAVACSHCRTALDRHCLSHMQYI